MVDWAALPENDPLVEDLERALRVEDLGRCFLVVWVNRRGNRCEQYITEPDLQDFMKQARAALDLHTLDSGD